MPPELTMSSLTWNPDPIGSSSGFASTDRYFKNTHPQGEGGIESTREFLQVATDRAAQSLSDPLSWGLQLGLAAAGNLVGYTARTGLRRAGCHFASLLTLGQVLSDEGASALITQNFRTKDGPFLRRYGYELLEGVIARGFLHFGMRIFHQIAPTAAPPVLQLIQLVFTGAFLAVGGILGEQATRHCGSEMPITPWTLTGLGLRIFDSQIGMLKGGALRSLPVIQRVSLDDWGRRLEERYGVEPYLNRLLQETLVVSPPKGRNYLEQSFPNTENPFAKRLNRDEFFGFLCERTRNIGGCLHADFQYAESLPQFRSKPWRLSYDGPDGVYRTDPSYYDAAVAILKLIRRAEQRGWNVLAEFNRLQSDRHANRLAFETLRESLAHADIPFRINHYFPAGTPDRKWLEKGWLLDETIRHPPEDPEQLGTVLRERLRNAATTVRLATASGWLGKVEVRPRLEQSVPKLRALVSFIEDMESQGQVMLDPQRFRPTRFVPLFLREEATHRLDPEHLMKDAGVLFGLERAALGQLLRETQGHDTSVLFGKEKGKLGDRAAVRQIKQFLAALQWPPGKT